MKAAIFALLLISTIAYSQDINPIRPRVYTTEQWNELGSIGALVMQDGEYLRIDAVSPGGPSELAGLKEGDLITEVDGQAMEKIKPEERIEVVRGKKGTKVVLTIMRRDSQSEFKATLKRTSLNDVLAYRSQNAAPLPFPAPIQRGSPLAASPIVFPLIDFKDQDLPSILEWLTTKSRELDPYKKGFVVHFREEDLARDSFAESVKAKKISLELKSTSINDAITIISKLTGFSLLEQENEIIFVPHYKNSP